MAEKLTDARVRAAKPKAVRYSIMHSGEPGFELRVSPSGRKTFTLRACDAGKDIRFRLGEYGNAPPRITLAEAERKARAFKARLDKEGDFREAERSAREAERERRKFTVGDLADAWLKEQAKHLRASTIALHKHRLDKHVRPRWGKWPIGDVSRADVRALVTELGEAGKRRTANCLKALIAALYRFAQDELQRDVTNPAVGMRGFAETSRSRVLSDTEIKRLWEALENPELPPGPAVKIALKIALYSAQRAGEVAGMRDNELDFAERVWRVPGSRTKSKRENVVPLTPRLIGLIKQAQALRCPPKRKKGKPFHDPEPLPADAPVFPSPASYREESIERHALTRGLARLLAALAERKALEIKARLKEGDLAAAERLRREKDFASASPHDLRRTARTLLSRERLGVNHDDSERLLSHQVGSALSRTYNQHDYAPEKRRALERLGAELDRITAGRPVEVADNVVELETARC